MSASVVTEGRRTTLPADVCEAAGVKTKDRIEWRFEGGEIRGRKLARARSKNETFPPGSLVQYFTREHDEEELAILSGCVQGPE